jgi:hypothetical protein
VSALNEYENQYGMQNHEEWILKMYVLKLLFKENLLA